MKAYFVYVTAANRDEALTIGRTVVEARLAACANVLDNMTSLYWWDDQVQEAGESVLVARTTGPLVESLIDRIKQLHSYDCPCVVAWPIEKANAAYLDWLGDETRTVD